MKSARLTALKNKELYPQTRHKSGNKRTPITPTHRILLHIFNPDLKHN
jgi:hypothetical protein